MAYYDAGLHRGMKFDRGVASFAIGTALPGRRWLAGIGKKRARAMMLKGENAWLRLKVAGYQFPEIVEDEWDSNWLIVEGSVCLSRREWRFRDPCLTTFEADGLADWLDDCAQGSAGPHCDFVEPNLQFDLVDPQTLRVSFALESAPPWAKKGDGWTMHGFNIPVGPSLTVAASELRDQLRHFPVRG